MSTASDVIRMEGIQALSFVSIHPVKCGMYYYKVKQMQNWAKYWDELQDVAGSKAAMIRCDVPLSSLDDARDYMNALVAHIFDGCRELELIVGPQKFVVKKIFGDEGGFTLTHWINNSHNWVRQCRYGCIFKGMSLFQFLEILHERMFSDNWNHFPSCYINY